MGDQMDAVLQVVKKSITPPAPASVPISAAQHPPGPPPPSTAVPPITTHALPPPSSTAQVRSLLSPDDDVELLYPADDAEPPGWAASGEVYDEYDDLGEGAGVEGDLEMEEE